MISAALTRWPELCWTTSPTSESAQKSLHKRFSGEFVPAAFVTDNDTHFSDWLKGLGFRPQSNGLAEHFVHTLRSAIHPVNPWSFVELDRAVDDLLSQYCNANDFAIVKRPVVI